MNRRLSIAAGLLLGGLAAAAPHRLHVYPNASLTVFSITQGPDGLLWLAAADGLYRFDGLHYDKITAYPFVSAASVGFTQDGSLWVDSTEGLARAVNHYFEVVIRESVTRMAVYPDQVFIRMSDGLSRVGLDGSITHLKHLTRRDFAIDTSGRLWADCLYEPLACWLDPKKPGELHTIALPDGLKYEQIAPASGERLWAADDSVAQLIEKGRVIGSRTRLQTREVARPGPLLEGRNGQLWFMGETVVGLNEKVEFQDRAENRRYPPISGFEDARGRMWEWSGGRGLIEWIPDPQWQRWFPEDFAGEPVVQAVRDGRGGMVAATQKNLYRLSDGAWKPIMREAHWFESVMPLEDGSFIACLREGGVVRIAVDGRIIEKFRDDTPGRREYRKVVRDGRGRLWVGGKQWLLRVEGKPGSMRLRPEELPDMPAGKTGDAVDMQVDSAGRLWVGYSQGIAWLDEQDKWHRVATDKPLTLVRSFTLGGAGDVWVTHRRAGSFTRVSNGKVTAFDAAAGYTPTNSYFIKRDSRGWIWRGSPDGVFVSNGEAVAPNDWLHLRMSNGLAANEMSLFGFFEDRDGSVWIAGDEGLTHILPDASWFQGSAQGAPQVTRVDADGHAFQFPAELPAKLPGDTKVLRIEIGSLSLPAFRDAPLRYRLGSGEWALSRDGVLEFRDLKRAEYALEVGFAGDPEGAVSTYRLQIGTLVSWGWTMALLAGAGVAFPVIRYGPWFERSRFRMARGLFLLRRRYSRNSYSSTERGTAGVDYSGETMSGRYQLTRVISRGGFSVVYEAHDLRGGGVVAVKVLNRSEQPDGRMRDRFAHEVAALRSVEHPGVVAILDSWISAAGEPCIATPLLDGSTLRKELAGGPLAAVRVARIVRQIGSALAEVHAHGIVHRDLKPENVILVGSGAAEQAVIIDFGTAGLRAAEQELAATTLMAGSFFYMAPERLTGHYSPASDVFSLGVIVLEMLTGKRLSDLNAMVSDEAFGRDLEKALRGALGREVAKAVGDRLVGAFDPRPSRRPGDVVEWTGGIAGALGKAEASR